MNKILIFVAVFIGVVNASAQVEDTDTLSGKQLQEVVVSAPRVIRKADMDVYYPNKSAVKNSQNGLQLLDNLMIPMITVSEMLSKVTAAGQEVQVRINGRISSAEQVAALLPETIKRVEWIDNPGLRYGDVNYVLNFIVINPTLGGSMMTSARPMLNQAFGLYVGDIKLNNGRSQWHLRSKYKLMEKLDAYRDYDETFTFPDGTSLTRDERPRGGDLCNSTLRSWASYSFIKPDTTVFFAELALRNDFSEKLNYNGILSLSDGSDDILLNDMHGKHGNTPSLSLYWQQSMSRQQMLIVNFNGTYYNGRSFSDYLEQFPNSIDYITDVRTSIKDRNLAFAMEADYIKNWENGRLTAGASYTANLNRSRYESLGNKIFHQRQNRAYMFSEYFHRLGKWSLAGGVGLQYTDFFFRESGQGKHSWSPRPQATVTYSHNPYHNFRVNFTSWQSAPSLVETNLVPQQLDGFQWRVGNPELKTANTYQVDFRYSFSIKRVNGSLGVRGFTSPDAITPYMFWDDDKLITSYENSRGVRGIVFSLSPQVDVVPGWLMAGGGLQYSMERSQGVGYFHRFNSWSGNANFRLMHWGFMLTGSYRCGIRSLWGERISSGDSENVIELTYKWKTWQFGGGVFMPFGKYDMSNESLNKWNRNEQHMRLSMRMPYITVAYNLQWGRQKREVKKIIDIEANADSSTAGSK